MRVLGASANCVDPIVAELEAAAFNARPFLIFGDGDDITAVVAEAGDSLEDLLKLAPRVAPVAA